MMFLKKIKFYTITALFLFVTEACTTKKNHNSRVLDDARAVMFSHPDSVPEILGYLDKNTLTPPGKARELLYSYHSLKTTAPAYRDDSLMTAVLDYIQFLDEKEDIAWAYYYKGLFLDRKGHNEAALGLLYLSRQLAVKLKDNYLLGKIYLANSEVFKKSFLFVASHTYGKMAFRSFTAADDSISANRALHNVILSGVIMGNTSEAHDLMSRSINFAERNNDNDYIVSILRSMMFYYIFYDKPAQSREYFDRLEKLITINDFTAREYIALGSFCMEENKFDSANNYLHTASEKAAKPIELITALRQLARLNRQTGNHEVAFQYLDKSNALYDSIYNYTHRSALVRQEVKAKAAEEELNALKTKNKKRLLIFTLSAVFISLGYGCLVLRKKWKKKSQMLAQLNRKLLEWKKAGEQNSVQLEEEIDIKLVYIRNLTDLYYRFSNNPQKFLPRLKTLWSLDPFNNDFKVDFILAVNARHGGVIEKLKQVHRLLNPDDVLLCSLIIVGFSSESMMTILQLPSFPALYMKKSRLKKKMNLTGTNIEDYLAGMAEKDNFDV